MANNKQRISEDPTKLEDIYDQMLSVMKKVGNRDMGVDAGETIAKAGHVAVKAVEIDLHGRMFAQKLGESGKMKTISAT